MVERLFFAVPWCCLRFVIVVFPDHTVGQLITSNLNAIPDAIVRNIIFKGPKYRFPSNIDFPK